MRRPVACFFAIALLLSAFGPDARSLAGSERSLHVYTWSGYFDHEVVERFEKRHGCRVIFDFYDSNETMLANLETVGKGAYDVVLPSAYMASKMNRRGMLLPIDHRLIPNLDNLDRDFLRFTEDPDMAYSVPYAMTVVGVGYDVGAVGRLEDTWDVFSRTDLAGRMIMLDDMRQAFAAALKYLGFSLNSVDDGELAKAAEVLRRWKIGLAGFRIDEFHIGLEAGDYHVSQSYNGDIVHLVLGGGGYAFFVPREGSAVTTDEFVILRGCEDVALAYAFINHFYDPEAAAANMRATAFYMPIPAALEQLPEDLLRSGVFAVPDGLLEKCEVIRDLGPDSVKYEKLWRDLRGK